MALVIQRFDTGGRVNHLASPNAGLPAGGASGADPSRRDKQGVYALSLVAEGEARLQAFLRQAEEKGGISGREEALFTSAQEEVRKIVEKSPEDDIGRVVARQLQGSLDAFRIRSRDVALREHLSHCDAQLRQRRSDVAVSVAGLAETARSAPDPALREQALHAVQRQVAVLRQAETAMAVAKSRYADSASPVSGPLPVPASTDPNHEETV